jgi:hypothetical protein
LSEFEAWWQEIGGQETRETIKEHLIHFGYAKMRHVCHISESIRRVGSGGNFATNYSEWLHIGNIKEPYSSNNELNCT